jgi:hypothetical protein
MKSLIILSLVVVGASALGGCLSTPEPTCNSTSYAPIVSATGPRTVGVNQPAVFTVVYTLGSDCGALSDLMVVPVPNSNTVQVAVMGTYRGCACNTTTTVSQTTYQFQAATAGTYRVQFLTGNNTFITDTVVVN